MHVRIAAICGVLAGLALAGCQAMTMVANSPPVEAKHTTYSVPLEGATSAAVTISSLVSAVQIEPLATSSPLLLDADLGYIGNLTTTSEGAEARTVVIADQLSSYSYNGPPLAFRIGLHRAPALRLSVSSGSGNGSLNLRDFNLRDLSIAAASGSLTIHLPAAASPYPVNAQTASGNIGVTLADGAAVQSASLSTASGDLQLTAGSGASVEAALNTSSGDITLTFAPGVTASIRVGTSSGDLVIHAPGGLPVRLEVVTNASGRVTVPARMSQVSGSGNTGVWQTAGYASDGPHLDIVVTNTASGDVTIQ